MQYPGEYGTFGVVRGPGKSVTVNNVLTFDPLTKQIGDALIINAWVNHFNSSDPVDIVVDFYDENNNHVGYDVMRPQQFLDEHGHGTGLWFIAGQYSPEDDSNLPADQNIRAAFFEVAQLTQAQKDSGQRPSTQGAPAQQRTYTKEVSWTGDDFVVAWGWHSEAWKWGGWGRRDFAHKHRMIQQRIINIITNPALANEYRVYPSPNGWNVGTTFQYQNNSDKQTLLNALASPNSRNFFWLGHGQDALFTPSSEKIPHTYITPNDISEALENGAFMRNNRIINREKVRKHPYRLVILMGCEMVGNEWPNAFGIDARESTVAEYQALQRKPRAMVIWTSPIQVPAGNDLFEIPQVRAPTNLIYAGREHTKMSLALAVLFSNWMANRPLKECMEAFEREALRQGFRGMDSWKIHGCIDLRKEGP